MDGQAASRSDEPVERAVASTARGRVPAVFVVELFLPSEADKLERAIKRHRWHDTASHILGNWDLLGQAQTEPRYDWWILGAIARPKNTAHQANTLRRKLPAEFDEVVLEGVRIGDGVTAVLATFFVSDVRHTELSQQSMHQSARRFLAKACPGFFVENEQPQPLIDLALFSRPDTSPIRQLSSGQETTSRATGFMECGLTAPESPAISLRRTARTSSYRVGQMANWTLSAHDRAIIEHAARHTKEPTRADDRALVIYLRRTVGDHLLQLSISELLSVHHCRYMQIRDQAPRRRGRLRMTHIREQRTNLLVLSLNVRTTERAIAHFNQRTYAHILHGQSTVGTTAGIDQQLAADQAKMLELLKADDEQYREILAAALSLTSSIQSLRASRVARWIAVASLTTSFLLLMLSDSSKNPRIASVVEWIANYR